MTSIHKYGRGNQNVYSPEIEFTTVQGDGRVVTTAHDWGSHQMIHYYQIIINDYTGRPS